MFDTYCHVLVSYNSFPPLGLHATFIEYHLKAVLGVSELQQTAAKTKSTERWGIPGLKLDGSPCVTTVVAVLLHAPVAGLAGAQQARLRVGQTTSGARAGSIVGAIHAHAPRLKSVGPESWFASVARVAPASLVPLEQLRFNFQCSPA
ncbi:hypothetical protein QQP08_007261 [Theobroma cacao]|nr:hypothetical protein QQP08_007261 [Theobroma cacao]